MDLTQDQSRILMSILSQWLPQEIRVFVYGSRARGTSRPDSDLDLLLESSARTPIPLDLLGRLRAELEDSSLPFSVDLVDACSMTPEMRALARRDQIELSYRESA